MKYASAVGLTSSYKKIGKYLAWGSFKMKPKISRGDRAYVEFYHEIADRIYKKKAGKITTTIKTIKKWKQPKPEWEGLIR